jgi:RNA polymerase sigma-70 factor (ECF subfamily)
MLATKTSMPAPSDLGFPDARVFATTHWSLVLAAKGGTTSAHTALSRLCETYWYPLYAFVRRQGHGPHDAQDLTQEFFARLLDKDWLDSTDPARGRFRSFLLVAVKRFLANEWDKARAQKRGGGATIFSMDETSAESRYRHEPAETITAEQLFDRRWALTLLDQVLARLRDEMASAKKLEQFEALKFCLTGENAAAYSEIARLLATSEGAVKVAIHRLRERYRALIRAEIAQTVGSEEEVDDELRQLFAALSV